MKATTPVKRSPWAHEVTVSRTRSGRWVVDRVAHKTILPADYFDNWDEAEWTGNKWANEELAERLADEEKAAA